MQTPRPFALERYFAQYEFSARYLLSCSDCEPMSMEALLETADADSRERWDHLKLGYTEAMGHPVLREAIADIYSGVGAEDILVAAPEEGIFLTMQALLRPGDHVVCTFPGYQSLYELARTIGCEVSLWEPEEDAGWRFDIDRLEGLMRDDTRLVVINFPHNPTGALLDRGGFDRLVEQVRENGVYLLSDEMYRFLEADPETRLPSACEVYEKAITLFGLSKTFGLPGLRIGWLAARDRGLLERMSRLKDYTTICSSAPSEILALMAVRGRDPLINGQRTRLGRNLKVLENFFRDYSDLFSWNRPRGGSVCFPRMTVVNDTFGFCEQLVRETGIMLVPSQLFDYGDHHVRVGFGREDLAQVLDRFAEYLNSRFR